jgi:FAD/FMN-containing dehydrogenase
MIGFPTHMETEEYSVGGNIEDWARLVSFKPRLYFRPNSLAELKEFLSSQITSAFKPGKIRVMGGLHSCSDICVSDVVIDVNDLPHVLEFNQDASVVTVSANWHFHEFLQAISVKGKSISATGGTDEQTLAGIIATNTAPATPHHTIYELVDWIEYITIDDINKQLIEKRVSRTDPDFPGVIGSLGAIGIITMIQMRLVDELYFETVQKIVSMDEMLKDVALTSRNYDFWRIDWIPDTDHGLAWIARRLPSGHPDGDYPQDKAQNIMVSVFNALDQVNAAGPLLDDPMLPVDRYSPLHVAMAEWSFNPADLQRLLQHCRDYFNRNGWPNLPIEIELTQTDNYWMSPWNWPGLDYIVKFNFMYLTDVIRDKQEREQMVLHLKGLWDSLLQAGIPFKAHWGKINFLDYDFVRSHYEFERFRPYMRDLFLNDYLVERVFPTHG